MIFANRQEAGVLLGKLLIKKKYPNPVVLALPRGGVPVGFEVAKILKASLDVVIARKIGAPFQEELGIGAISENKTLILDAYLIDSLQIPKELIEKTIKKETLELNRQISLYRQNRKLPKLPNKTAIIVDDGLATGVTAKAAIKFTQTLNPKTIVFAAPVCSAETEKELSGQTNIVCVASLLELAAIGSWYKDFSQVSDNEVLELLEKSKFPHRPQNQIFS